MSGNLFYLMTRLPSLPPEPGVPPEEDVIALIRGEEDAFLQPLADLMDCEREIQRCGDLYFVDGSKDYQPAFSSNVPAEFIDIFMTYTTLPEAAWIDAVYSAWFDMVFEHAEKHGSTVLADWVRWEYSLRVELAEERQKKYGDITARSAAASDGSGRTVDHVTRQPGFMSDQSVLSGHGDIINTYFLMEEPLKAEEYLDQNRIDFLRNRSAAYTFSSDELVAYLLELRVHNRYAGLDPEKGRKILEEVARL